MVDCLNVTGGYVPGLPYPLGGGCKAKWTEGGVDKMSQQIKASEPKVIGAVKKINQLSPKATVFLVNYLAGIREPGCYPFQPASNEDQVEGFLPLSLNQPAIAVPFHPNSAGADAQAAIVASAVTR